MPDTLTNDDIAGPRDTHALLVGGPQDGATVMVPLPNPVYIHVGPKWLGDGLAAWSKEPSRRFPARYVWDGRGNRPRYHFGAWLTASEDQLPTEPERSDLR